MRPEQGTILYHGAGPAVGGKLVWRTCRLENGNQKSDNGKGEHDGSEELDLVGGSLPVACQGMGTRCGVYPDGDGQRGQNQTGGLAQPDATRCQFSDRTHEAGRQFL